MNMIAACQMRYSGNRRTFSILLVISMAMFLSMESMGQLCSQYAFATGTDAVLDPMVGSTNLVSASSDDGASTVQSIGFTFNFLGTDHTQYSANVNGLVRLGATAVTTAFTNSLISTTFNPKIMALWDDHHTGVVAGGGKIHSVLIGSPGSQIRIIEWFVTVPRNTSGNANTRFQCWLYEGTNVLEFRYGTSGGNFASGTIGISNATTISGDYNVITSTTAHTASISTTTTIANGLTAWPGSGRYYRFTPPVPCTAVAGGTASATVTSGCGTISSSTLSVTGSTSGVTGLTYQWYSGPEGGPYTTAMGTAATQAVSAVSSTTAYVRTTTCSNGGASDTSTPIVLTVTPNPVVSITASDPGPFCGTANTVLTGSGASTYSWSPATGLDVTTGESVTSTTTSTTTYTVTGTANGCIGTSTHTVAVDALPVITDLTATPSTVCVNGNSQLHASVFVPTTTNLMNFNTGTGAALDPMAGATVRVPSSVDDAPMASPANIGFTFYFNGVPYTQFSASPDGWVRFGAVSAGSEFTNSVVSTSNLPKIYPYWDDVATGSNGSVVSMLEGTAPQRILKIQWFVTIPRNTSGAANSTFQTWLYEEDGRIEFRYGAMNPASMSASVGLTAAANNYQSVSIDSGTSSTTVPNNSNSVQPSNGTIYTFSNQTPGVLWSPSTFLDATNIPSPIASGINVPSQTYTVTATSSSGCSASSDVTVSTSAPINSASIQGTPSFCTGTSTTLTAVPANGGGPFSYLWSPGGETTASITVSIAGDYSVQVMDNCGGSVNTGVTTMTESPAPVASITGPTTGVTYENLLFEATGFSGTPNFQWQSATALAGQYANIGTNSSTQQLTSNAGGTFYVRNILTDPLNGCSATSNVITVVITVAGDNVCSANPIIFGANGPYSNVGATLQSGEASPPVGSCTGQATWCFAPSNTVWFSFVAPSTGRISLNMGSTQNWDSQIAVWSAPDCNALLTGGGTLLAANDDITGSSPFHSAITPLCVTPGVTYFVQVDGYSTTTNNAFQLVLVEEPSSLSVNVSSATPTVCSGSDGSFSLSGTPGATVTYSIDGGSPQTVTLAGGSASIPVTGVTSAVSIEIISISSGTCTSLISGMMSSIGINTDDTDTDGTIDCEDGCPNDPLKIAPGQCGCGNLETDTDADGTADCNDLCPADPNKTAPGQCGCGNLDTDTDNDGTADCNDLCPTDANKTVPGLCGCGLPDSDVNNNGICDLQETLPTVQLGIGSSGNDHVEIRLQPDNFFNGLFSSSVVTIRWLTTPGVTLDGASATYVDPALQTAAGPLLHVGTTTNGIYSYSTFATYGNATLQSVGLSWAPNVIVPFFRVPYTNTTNSCVVFEVVDDAFQAATNRSWYTSLNGVESNNGYILGSTAAETAPAANCQNISVTLVDGTASITTGDITSSFQNCGQVTLSLDQSTFTCADVGENLVTLTINSSGVITTCQSTVTVISTLQASATTTPILCNGDLSTVNVTATGGSEPYTGTGTFQVLAGTYAYTVTDDNGCTSIANATITQPDAIVAEVSSATIPCPGGTTEVLVTATGGTGILTGTGSFQLPAGIHSFTIEDENGCSSTVQHEVLFVLEDADGDGVCDDEDVCPNSPEPGMACDDLNAGTINDTVDGNCLCAGTPIVVLQITALLDGPYDQMTGLMNDNLRATGLIPGSQPYAAAPFNHAGTETVDPSVLLVTGDDAIVDWVLLELRDHSDPASITFSRAALVQRDGDVVDVDGTSAVTFSNVLPGSYHVAVRHRNHFGAMTATSLPLNHIATPIDLTTAATMIYGFDARKDVGGAMLLWGANALPDGQLKYTGTQNDRDPILVKIGGLIPTAINTGYHVEDVNMNGFVSYAGANNDRDPILVNLDSNVIGVRLQQLP